MKKGPKQIRVRRNSQTTGTQPLPKTIRPNPTESRLKIKTTCLTPASVQLSAFRVPRSAFHYLARFHPITPDCRPPLDPRPLTRLWTLDLPVFPRSGFRAPRSTENYQTNPFVIFGFARKQRRFSLSPHEPAKKRTQISPSFSSLRPLRLCVNSEFLMFRPCTLPRAAAKLST